MSAARTGPSNSNWRGGRTVTPAGYVLLRLPGHPCADVRGYVYEHRLVMEEVLGRPLGKGEKVLHVDGDPSNNDPANLRLIRPLDRAELTECACGCGATMTRLDRAGRARKFVSGHNSVRRRSSDRRPRRETGNGLPEAYRELWSDLFGGLCAYGCGQPAECWDHLIPWCEGGSFTRPGNAVPACTSCNLAKSGTAAVWEWIDRGLASDQASAWVDLVGLGLSWGDLEVPEAATA